MRLFDTPHVRPLACTVVFALFAATAWPEQLRVRVAQANLRAEPSTTAAVVGRLARGAVLEVVETAGQWFKVETADGRMGYVHAQVVERLAPAATPGAAAAGTSARPAPAGVAIAHDEVGCVVAGQHPRLEACLSPDDTVGRAHVVFRAKDTDPWYAVAMTREGRCHAAVLPRPQRDIKGFQYFVDVIDRNFAQTVRPERAPDRAFTPRVVGRKVECEAGRVVAAALGQLTRPVVVGVLRDASGRVLDAAAARALESKLLLSGFSPEGVIVSSTGAPPGSAAQTASAGSGASGVGAGAAGGTAGAAAGGIGVGTLAIAGGAVAAAGLVAVAAGGGGESEQPLTATGRWTSPAGGGLLTEVQAGTVSCSFGYDIVADLTESNGALSGQMSYTTQTSRCTSPDPELQRIIGSAIFGASGTSGSAPVGGRASAGALTLVVATLTFNGSYTRTALEATAALPIEGAAPVVYRLRLTRN